MLGRVLPSHPSCAVAQVFWTTLPTQTLPSSYPQAKQFSCNHQIQLPGTEDSLVHHDWVENTRKKLEEKKVSLEFRLVQGLEHEMAKGQIGELMGWLAQKL